MRDFVSVMKALSEPNRVRMLKLISRRPLCVCELTDLMGLAQPTISKHLGVLENAGLARGRREGPWVLYELSAEGSRYARELIGKLQGWLDEDPELSELYERQDRLDRRKICSQRFENIEDKANT